MVIRKKDGSTYRLQSPNYNMVNQEFWNGESINIHNFNIKKDQKIEEPKPPIDNLPELVEFHIDEDAIKSTSEEFIEPEELVEDIHMEVKGIDKNQEFHCLPAKTEIIYDELYNERKIKTKYLKPIKIQLTIIKNNDFEFKLSTNLELDFGSIVFNSNDKRWWKVDSTYFKNDKYISSCVPSNYEPYFED